jgi:hypothetical protein
MSEPNETKQIIDLLKSINAKMTRQIDILLSIRDDAHKRFMQEEREATKHE